MYRRQERTRQLLVLIAVIFLTLALQGLLQTVRTKASALTVTDWVHAALFLQTGVRVTDLPVQPTEPAAEEITVPAADPPAESAPTAEPLVFTTREADTIDIAGACTYAYDKAALLLQPLAADFTQPGPQVLIVHTHTTESYTPETGQAYQELTHARTLDNHYNMVRVGQQVAQSLEQQGIGVIHDTTVNDYPNYDGAYDRMKGIIEENLARYPTIQMVLDLHRDAAADENGNPLPLTASFPDGEYAQLMLVVGTDEGGLYHPNWQQNLSTGLKLQALLERDYPQLCRSLNLRQERFNQNQTPCSLLIEFGTDGNTLSQALRSADALGEALAQLILNQSTT